MLIANLYGVRNVIFPLSRLQDWGINFAPEAFMCKS